MRATRPKPCWPYFLVSAICFAAAAVCVLIEPLGLPMVFAFATLCSVFLTFGALAGRPPLERDRRSPGGRS